MMITKQKVIDTIQSATELLEHGWIKGRWAVDLENKSVEPWDESACKWCFEGAVLAVTHYDEDGPALADACIRIIQMANKEFTIKNPRVFSQIVAGHTTSATKISSASAMPTYNDAAHSTQQDILRIMRNGLILAKHLKWR